MPDFPTGARISPSSSKVIWLTDQTTPFTPVSIYGSGSLDFLFVLSQSNSYRVVVTIDNQVVVDSTFDELSSLPEEVHNVAAWYDSEYGKYLLYLSDFSFSRNIKIDIIHTTSQLTIDIVFSKVDVMV